MRYGVLDCAGRTSVSSIIMQDLGIKHVVGWAPYHAIIIIETNSTTMTYFDANNDVYFSFPKAALEGYSSSMDVTECKIKEFHPRNEDVFDGINRTWRHFVTMPPTEGISRQYLRNVSAALSGNKEFAKSNIETDVDASNGIPPIEKELFGSNSVLESFLDRTDQFSEQDNVNQRTIRSVVTSVLKEAPTEALFVKTFADAVPDKLGEIMPYVQHASIKSRIEFAQRMWNIIHNEDEALRRVKWEMNIEDLGEDERLGA